MSIYGTQIAAIAQCLTRFEVDRSDCYTFEMEKLSFLFLCLVLCTGVNSKSLTQDSPTEEEGNGRPCGLNGECVGRFLCSDNGTIIRDGKAIIDMRELHSRAGNNNGCNWQEICCNNEKKVRERVLEELIIV